MLNLDTKSPTPTPINSRSSAHTHMHICKYALPPFSQYFPSCGISYGRDLDPLANVTALGRFSYDNEIRITGSHSDKTTLEIILYVLHRWKEAAFMRAAPARGKCIHFHKHLHIFLLFMMWIRWKDVCTFKRSEIRGLTEHSTVGDAGMWETSCNHLLLSVSHAHFATTSWLILYRLYLRL